MHKGRKSRSSSSYSDFNFYKFWNKMEIMTFFGGMLKLQNNRKEILKSWVYGWFTQGDDGMIVEDTAFVISARCVNAISSSAPIPQGLQRKMWRIEQHLQRVQNSWTLATKLSFSKLNFLAFLFGNFWQRLRACSLVCVRSHSPWMHFAPKGKTYNWRCPCRLLTFLFSAWHFDINIHFPGEVVIR